MKKNIRFIFIVYIFLLICGSVYGVGESTIVIGGGSTWRLAEFRDGVTEIDSVRPHPVLVLSSAAGSSTAGYSAAAGVLGNFAPLTESALDLSLSFDEREPGLFRDSVDRYKVSVSPAVEAVDRRYARGGTGAALFGGGGAVSIEPQTREALFAADNRIRDFTIEFWLYPQNMENGEQILSWTAVRPAITNGNYLVQRIVCDASRNRLHWTFVNFFASTTGTSYINVEFSGDAPVVPKTWSHHLVRFDAATGMVEYLVNGRSEAIVYASPTGRENPAAGIKLPASMGGEVFAPIAGSGGNFLLGERFNGIIDEFKIHGVFAGRSHIQKYAPSGGRIETRPVDLGDRNSSVLRIDACGGRTTINGNSIKSEFRENGRFRFSDAGEMNFFIRASDNPYLLNERAWFKFTPGEDISGIKGRYVQIAVDFYPSADGESSPYLYDMRIIYFKGEPPLPPVNLTAVAADGGVLLRWRHSPSSQKAGYLVYYSAVRGELYGDDALMGPSPIDAGNRNSIFIDGLKNGTLYYFRVASYDNDSGEYYTGEFSGEVMSRPLAGLSLSEIGQR